MGCIKSKQNYAVHNTVYVDSNHETEGSNVEEKIALVQANQVENKKDVLTTNPILLEYAHRLSEEIVNKAVKQWAEVDMKYSDIPYIESDLSDISI
uniref:Small membrane A-kinase anchor protein n=1 Tax=Leptobrachium leishanense TaxID=445787 RepID=A0A8C5QH45_9ANUR